MSDPAGGAQDEDNPRTVLMHEVDPALADARLPEDDSEPPPSDSAVETTAETDAPPEQSISDIPPLTEPPPRTDPPLTDPPTAEMMTRTEDLAEMARAIVIPSDDHDDPHATLPSDEPLVPEDPPEEKPISKPPPSREPLANIKATYRIDRVVVRVPGGESEEDDDYNPRTVPIHEISAEAIERARAAARKAVADQDDDDDNPRTLHYEAPEEKAAPEESDDKTTNWDRGALLADLEAKVGDEPQRLSPTSALEIPGLIDQAVPGNPAPLIETRSSADITWQRPPAGPSRPPPDLSHVNLVRLLLIGVVVLVLLLVAIGILMARRGGP